MAKNETRNGLLSFAAHTGGAFCGLLFGSSILRNPEQKNYEIYIKNFFLVLFTIFFTFLIWTVGRDRVHYENHGCLEGKKCFNLAKEFVGHIDYCYQQKFNET